MRSFKTFVILGFLTALIGSVTLLDATPQAYAQQCPNGVCP
ncbi:hypothetical protein [Mesorhizobium sp. WSM2240]|jgi:hypothetical protein